MLRCVAVQLLYLTAMASAMKGGLGVQTKEVLDAMVQDAGGEGFSLLRVDGGASRNDVLMQLQADAIQVPYPFLSAPA